MKKLPFMFLVLAAALASPARSQESEPGKGMVIIGVAGDAQPVLAWREIDPVTGRLKPFEVTKNVASGAGSALSDVFGGLGRLGRRDKRFAPNAAGMSYSVVSLKPGTYILEALTLGRRRAVFAGPVPIVRIEAGQATYAGDYAIAVEKGIGGVATAKGRSLAGAANFVAMFPKVTDKLVEVGSGTATLSCVGKLVAFADQIVCDAEQSRVTGITLGGGEFETLHKV